MEQPDYPQELDGAMKHGTLLVCSLAEARHGGLNIHEYTFIYTFIPLYIQKDWKVRALQLLKTPQHFQHLKCPPDFCTQLPRLAWFGLFISLVDT